MTMDFHKNHYVSSRGERERTISFAVPERLRAELLALSVAREEPRWSLLLRIVEAYVDDHQDEVAKGTERIAPESRGGWSKEWRHGKSKEQPYVIGKLPTPDRLPP